MKYFRVSRRSLPAGCACIVLSTGVTLAAQADELGYELSERDYLSEIPHIYSASRLPQQLEDAAGALTVTKQGASPSLPHRAEVDAFLTERSSAQAPAPVTN